MTREETPTLLVFAALLLILSAGSPAGSALADGLEYVQQLGGGTGLQQPDQVVATRDGSRLFVLDRRVGNGFLTVSPAFGTLASFASDSEGKLRFVEVLHAGVGDLASIREPVSLALSPDERFLYLGAQVVDPAAGAFSTTRPAIVTLAIAPDGELSFRSLAHLDLPTFFPTYVAPSPEGQHLYVLAAGDAGFEDSPVLATFERTRTTGDLRLVQEEALYSLLGLPEWKLDRASNLMVAPDGRHLYVMTYDFGNGISIPTLVRDPNNGRITATRPLPPASVVPELADAVALQVNGDGTRVYAALDSSESLGVQGKGRLVVFERQGETGDLVDPRVLSVPSGFPDDGASIVSVTPDDLHAYQCLSTDALQVFLIDHGLGRLDPAQDLEIRHEGSGTPGCGKPLLSSDGGTLILARTRAGHFDNIPVGAPRPQNGSLTSLDRDPATGAVVITGSLLDGEGAPTSLDDLKVAIVSPDGRHVYALREGEEWSLVAFRRRLLDRGMLEYLPHEALPLGVAASRDSLRPALIMSPDGRHLYVGFTEELVVIAREIESSRLHLVGRSSPGSRSIAISEDGRHVYVRGSAASIITYARHAATGELVAFQDLQLPNAGSHYPAGLALSPDGRNLYSTSESLGLAVLTRDPSDGRLEFVEELPIEGDPGPGLDHMLGVSVSPDGRHVLTGVGLHTFPATRLLVFDRDSDNGSLSPNSRSDGRTWSLVFSPEGRSLYVLQGDPLEHTNTVRALLRDPVSGRLERDGDWLAEGIELGRVPAVSPEGANLYVPGAYGISAFASRWFSSPEIPGFRFQVSIDTGSLLPLLGRPVAECLPGTVCARGAVPGRTEALLRIVGPKPNGRLWPTLVKFSTSPMDVDIDQFATGELRSYHLAGAAPGSDELPGLFDRGGFAPIPGGSGIRWSDASDAGEELPMPPRGTAVFTSEDFPNFRFQVRLTAGGEELPVRRENACFDETLCVSGAVPGRSEVFLRIVGPKPNGFLWPTLVRTTTSTVEVWIEQVSSGEIEYYRLEGASPGSTDLTGLFDRQGFLP